MSHYTSHSAGRTVIGDSGCLIIRHNLVQCRSRARCQGVKNWLRLLAMMLPLYGDTGKFEPFQLFCLKMVREVLKRGFNQVSNIGKC
jgi:hypothetical protein